MSYKLGRHLIEIERALKTLLSIFINIQSIKELQLRHLHMDRMFLISGQIYNDSLNLDLEMVMW
jgi:hypothetical protein